jgi:hypothetical protein
MIAVVSLYGQAIIAGKKGLIPREFICFEENNIDVLASEACQPQAPQNRMLQSTSRARHVAAYDPPGPPPITDGRKTRLHHPKDKTPTQDFRGRRLGGCVSVMRSYLVWTEKGPTTEDMMNAERFLTE